MLIEIENYLDKCEETDNLEDEEFGRKNEIQKAAHSEIRKRIEQLKKSSASFSESSESEKESMTSESSDNSNNKKPKKMKMKMKILTPALKATTWNFLMTKFLAIKKLVCIKAILRNVFFVSLTPNVS